MFSIVSFSFQAKNIYFTYTSIISVALQLEGMLTLTVSSTVTFLGAGNTGGSWTTSPNLISSLKVLNSSTFDINLVSLFSFNLICLFWDFVNLDFWRSGTFFFPFNFFSFLICLIYSSNSSFFRLVTFSIY